jgi:hypothetical protein
MLRGICARSASRDRLGRMGIARAATDQRFLEGQAQLVESGARPRADS